MFGLKKAFQQAFNGTERMDEILAMPITKLRMELKDAFQGRKFPQEQYDDFVKRLGAVDNIKDQAAIAAQAVTDRQVNSEFDIELDTPAKQLLWAATLTRISDAGTKETGKVQSSQLWRQIQNSIGVSNESIRVAKMLSTAIQNDEVTFDWGGPGSWFYFNPSKNHINLDLYFMLLMGFEHVRTIYLHEIGHSQLTNQYPASMQEIYERVKEYIDPSTIDKSNAKPMMTEADEKKVNMDAQAWSLWHKAFNKFEDICVDRYAINQSMNVNQDMRFSRNFPAVTLQGFGDILEGKDLVKPIDVSDMTAKAKKDPMQQFRDKIEELKAQKKKATTKKEKQDIAAQKKQVEAVAQIAEAQIEQQIREYQKKIETHNRMLTNPLSDAEVAAIKAGKITPDIAEKMFNEITTGALLAGMQRNDLFSNQDKNWERLRIYPDDIRRTVDMSAIPDANGRDAFKYLTDLAAGKNDSIMTSQPQNSDSFALQDGYDDIHDSYCAVVKETTTQRMAVMEKIWNIFVKPYADVLLKEYEDKLDQQAQQEKEGQGNGQGKPGQGGSGQGKPGQGGSGSGQPGEGEGSPGEGDADGGDSQQMPQSGLRPDAPQRKQQGGGGQQDDQQQDGGDKQDQKSGGGGDKREISEETKKNLRGMSSSPEEAREKEREEKNEDGAGGSDPKKDDAGQGNDGDEKKDADGGDAESEKEKENEAKGKKKDGSGGPGWGHDEEEDAQNPKKVGQEKTKDMIDDSGMSDEQKEKTKSDAARMPKGSQGGLGLNAGIGRGIDYASQAKGDWRDFATRMLELAPIVDLIAKQLIQIRAMQRKTTSKMGKTHDFMAQDGDYLGRLDRNRVLDIKFRQATRQPMTGDDLKKIRKDDIHTDESSIELFIAVDGSGSMSMVHLAGGVTAQEIAMQNAAIYYMACRKAEVDCYLIVWGDNEPRIVAKPGDPLSDVGERLETLRGGIHSGTSLAPALKKCVELMAETKKKAGTISGSSHVLIYSDGDIADAAPSKKAMTAIVQEAKNMTFDVAVLVPKGNSSSLESMEQVFQETMDENGSRQIGMMRGDDAEIVPIELSQILLRRVKSSKVKTEPDPIKRARFKKIDKSLKNN